MNLRELIAKFRSEAKDVATPYLFGNIEIIDWLKEAEDEACIRGRLLFDDSTLAICEIAVLTGTREYAIDPRITEVVRAYLTDAYSIEHDLDIVERTWLDEQFPSWRKQADGLPTHLMHLSKRIAFDREPSADYTLTQEVYRKPLVPINARNAVTLQGATDTVTHVAHGGTNGDAVMFAEINLTTGIVVETTYFMRDVTVDTYSLCAVAGGPALPLTTDGTGLVIYLDAAPEVEEIHHRHLLDWVMYQAFIVPDADSFSPGKSAAHDALFEQHFGPPVLSETRRFHNAHKPRANPSWF